MSHLDDHPDEVKNAAYYRRELAKLREELEVERMRLAACGTAALGYFDGCNDEYKSASLDDVLRLKQCSEAAEAKLNAASEQEPICFGLYDKDGEFQDIAHTEAGAKDHLAAYDTYASYLPLYAEPIPPVDVQELQERAQFWVDRCGMLEARSYEQERKVAEQQATMKAVAEWLIKNCPEPALELSVQFPSEELNTLLAKAREEGRLSAIPDVQLLCKFAVEFFYWWHNQPGTNTADGFEEWYALHGKAMLAAAPTLGER